MLISLLFQNPLAFVFLTIALIISISFHEAAHAFMATKLGDPTARALGRVTLNPAKHLDPIGTLLLLVAGFGWGRPVPFDPSFFKNPKRDTALVSFAGPASNFLLAIIFALLLQVLPSVRGAGVVGTLFYLIVFYNLVLGFFNLIPIHPLDGFKVVYGLLPYDLAAQWMQMAPYGVWILMVLILTRATSGILQPLLNFSLQLLGLGKF